MSCDTNFVNFLKEKARKDKQLKNSYVYESIVERKGESNRFLNEWVNLEGQAELLLDIEFEQDQMHGDLGNLIYVTNLFLEYVRECYDPGYFNGISIGFN